MDIRPEWTLEFLERCAKADETFGWKKGTAFKEAGDFLEGASIEELEEAIDNEYIDFDIELFDSEDAFVGPYQVRTVSLTIDVDDIAHWKEYLSKVITIRRLENGDEKRA